MVSGKYLGKFLFGDVDFSDDEEYLKFRHQLLLANIWVAVVITSLCSYGMAGIEQYWRAHARMREFFTVTNALFIILLRVYKGRFLPIAVDLRGALLCGRHVGPDVRPSG